MITLDGTRKKLSCFLFRLDNFGWFFHNWWIPHGQECRPYNTCQQDHIELMPNRNKVKVQKLNWNPKSLHAQAKMCEVKREISCQTHKCPKRCRSWSWSIFYSTYPLSLLCVPEYICDSIIDLFRCHALHGTHGSVIHRVGNPAPIDKLRHHQEEVLTTTGQTSKMR